MPCSNKESDRIRPGAPLRHGCAAKRPVGLVREGGAVLELANESTAARAGLGVVQMPTYSGAKDLATGSLPTILSDYVQERAIYRSFGNRRDLKCLEAAFTLISRSAR